MSAPAKRILARARAHTASPKGRDYQRGQIQWGMEEDDIVGRAFIHAGPGLYTHLAYFRGPEGSCMCGKIQLPHPIQFRQPGVIEVYPITNADLGC